METLIPHGEVASSMICCRIALILSRSERSSSSTCWPRTLRSVVCAICEVATMKFSTCTIARSGSMIRKYATAFTRTGTLSFVITSCGGTFNVTVRRSTRTILSITGMSRKRPGPFGGERRRPRRKMTPRSYSRATRIAAESRSRMMTTTAAIAISAMLMAPSYAAVSRRDGCRSLDRADDEHEPFVDRKHADLFSRGRRSCLDPRAPELAVDEDEALRVEGLAHDPDVADELLLACLRPRAPQRD